MRTPIAVSLLLLPACLAAGAAHAAKLPAGARVFTGASVARMLHQCSRAAPSPGDGSWMPRAADIAAFEQRLPAALKAQMPGQDWSKISRDYLRQYVGIVRGPHRYIYGNFVPRHGDGPATDKPIIVCDGGPSFFGAEYDVSGRKISHLAFNGRI